MPRFTDAAIAPIAEVTNDRVVDNGNLNLLRRYLCGN